MSKLRGLFFSLGLVALSGLMASEASAETLTLSVFAGTDTTAPAIYSTIGGSTAVTADTGILNGNLAASGFGAYSFSNLGGSSNNPGSTLTGPLGGAYILTSGNLIVTPGGSGESTPITVLLSEGGFTLPSKSPSLVDTGTANFAGATGAQGSEGVLTDASGTSTTVAIPGLTGTGIQTASKNPGIFATPFSLESQTILTLDSVNGLPGSNGFSQKVQLSAAAAVPEPASLVLMLTSMPLPLVVMGLLRRRRAAA